MHRLCLRRKGTARHVALRGRGVGKYRGKRPAECLFRLRKGDRHLSAGEPLPRRFADVDCLGEGRRIFERNEQIAVALSEQIARGKRKAQPVAEAGFHDRCRRAALFGDGGKDNVPALNICAHPAAERGVGGKIGNEMRVLRDGQAVHLRARLRKDVGDEFARPFGCERKGDERGRYVDVLEGAAHAVLAADGAQPQPDLCVQRAEERRERHTPALGVGAEPHKEFLEGEADAVKIAPRRNELGDGTDDRIDRARERRGTHQLGRITVGGNGRHVRLAADQLCRHRDDGRELVLSAERHVHAARADSRVEHLREPLFGADVERRERRKQPAAEIDVLFIEEVRRIVRDLRVRHLFYAVRIEKIAGQIDDRAALEEHLHAPVVRDRRDGRCVEVLLRGKTDKFRNVLLCDDDRHALLRFGDGKLGAREPLIFERNFVKLDDEPVRKFADGDGDAARAEVVALFDAAGRLFVQKQPLQLALGERVALLHLRAAGLHRMRVVRLG